MFCRIARPLSRHAETVPPLTVPLNFHSYAETVPPPNRAGVIPKSLWSGKVIQAETVPPGR